MSKNQGVIPSVAFGLFCKVDKGASCGSSSAVQRLAKTLANHLVYQRLRTEQVLIPISLDQTPIPEARGTSYTTHGIHIGTSPHYLGSREFVLLGYSFEAS